MTRDYSGAGIEPSLAEVLDDPLVQLLMRRDRLQAAEVRRVIDAARRRLAAARANAAGAEPGAADPAVEPPRAGASAGS